MGCDLFGFGIDLAGKQDHVAAALARPFCPDQKLR